jgi:hypothetical protein
MVSEIPMHEGYRIAFVIAKLQAAAYIITCWKRADASHGRNESIVLII